MQRTSFADMHCSIAQTMDIVGEWWTPLIVRDIYMGLHRFEDITQNLGISRNLLTLRFERLIAKGIVRRCPYQERPPRFEYHLTEAGKELVPVLMAVMAWGDRWAALPDGPPATLVHDRCGHPFTPQVTCPECGEPVSADEVTPTPGPGAAAGPGTRVLARGMDPAED